MSDNEADDVLDTLPRCNSLREGLSGGREAFVYIGADGGLNILIDEGGWLGLDERNLGYLKGDGCPFETD